MEFTGRVREILSWYHSDNPGTKTNIARLLNHGRLAGSGRLVILPVDQGFEHGPARSFAPNPSGYDPEYHAQLAIDSGCNAYAAPLGFLEAVAGKLAGQIPLILKLNNSDTLSKGHPPCSAVTGSVKDAVRLGCAAMRNTMYQDLRELIAEAKDSGLAAVVWSYPRGEGITDKKGETAVDVAGYAAHIACELGAHIVKVKPPMSSCTSRRTRRSSRSSTSPSRRWPIASATSCSAASTASASSSSPVARQRALTSSCRRSAGCATAGPSARSWAATPSSGRTTKR